MKTFLKSLALGTVVLGASLSAAQAQNVVGTIKAGQANESMLMAARTDVPRVLGYQGVLTENNGAPVADGEYVITARLYRDAMGTDVVWEGAYKTTVKNGVVNLTLGSGLTPLPAAEKLNGSLFLGIKVGDKAEMKPFTQLTASAFALNVPDGSISAEKIQKGAITPEKLDMEYVRSISLNGKKVSAKGGDVNFVAGEGLALAYDPVANAVVLKGAASSTGKGNSLQDVGDVTTNGRFTVNGPVTFSPSVATPNRGDSLKFTSTFHVGSDLNFGYYSIKKLNGLDIVTTNPGGSETRGKLNFFNNGVAGNSISIQAATPSASRTYTLPDAGADAAILLNQGNQTITGSLQANGFNANSNRISGVAAPSGDNDAANKYYVDQTIGSLTLLIAPGSHQSSSSTNPLLWLQKTNATGNFLQLEDNSGTSVATIDYSGNFNTAGEITSPHIEMSGPVVDANDVTTKKYVDDAISSMSVHGVAPIEVDASNNVSITAATGSNAGSMSAADKTKLDAATSANTASTIVMRDANGDFSASAGNFDDVDVTGDLTAEHVSLNFTKISWANVTNDLTVDGDATVVGDVNADGVSANTGTFQNSFSWGATNTGAFSQTGASAFAGDITQSSGTATLGNTTVGTLNATTGTFSGDVTTTGTVTGAEARFNFSKVKFESVANDLTVSGSTALQGLTATTTKLGSTTTADLYSFGATNSGAFSQTGTSGFAGDITQSSGTATFGNTTTGDLTGAKANFHDLSVTTNITSDDALFNTIKWKSGVGTDLTVSGTSSLGTASASTLDVSGESHFTGNMGAGKVSVQDISITKFAEVGTTLSVGGAASFSDVVSIAKHATLSSDLSVGGNSDFGGDITATGDLTARKGNFGWDLAVGKSAIVSENLSVGGTSTLTGDVTASGNVTISKHASIGSGLGVTGDISATGDLSAKNGNFLWDVAVGKKAIVSESLTVGGTGSFGDDVTMSKHASIGAGLSVTGDASFSNDITVANKISGWDLATQKGAIVGTDLSVGGNSEVTGTSTVHGESFSWGVSNTGSFSNSGNASIGGKLDVNGATTLHDLNAGTTTLASADVTGNTNIGGELDVLLDASVHGQFFSWGQTNTGNIANDGEITSTGNISTDNSVNIGNDLYLNSNVSTIVLNGQAGSSGDVLTSNGSDFTPTWVANNVLRSTVCGPCTATLPSGYSVIGISALNGGSSNELPAGAEGMRIFITNDNDAVSERVTITNTVPFETHIPAGGSATFVYVNGAWHSIN